MEWRLNERELAAILRRRKPTRIFMCDMLDIAHEDVPFGFVDQIWETMRQARQHTFQVLTKRPERMQHYLRDWAPLPNVWLGVSVENQRMADERIPVLLDTPAAVRFLSCEPFLWRQTPDLRRWLMPRGCAHPLTFYRHDKGCLFEYEDGHVCGRGAGGIDWVIVGGESGPGSAERKLVERCWHCCDRHRMECEEGRNDQGHHHWPGGPPASTAMKLLALAERSGEELSDLWSGHWCPKPRALEWVRSLRDQCVAAGVPFFFKQWGATTPKAAGALIDGKEWRQMP